MFVPPRRGPSTLVLIAAFGIPLGALPLAAEERSPRSDVVRIGLIGSLFRDVPRSAALAMMQPFGALMESQTGMSGDLVPGGDANDLAEQLVHGKVQLAVFHGIEFAWARVKHPELRPLVIAINRDRRLQAYLIVRAESDAECLADLGGKTLALPQQSKEHCRLFVERRCRECKKDASVFFTKITNPANVEAALDDVVDGIAEVTVVDRLALDCFKRRKPGRYARLRVLHTSEVFPAAVVAYCPGVLDEAILERFHDGMIGAGRTALGKQLLTLWKLTGFDEVPDDYEETLAAIVKVYPPPSRAK